jgi:SAM-dependent methyltransferase
VSSEHNDEDPGARIEQARREIRAQAAGLRERPLLARSAGTSAHRTHGPDFSRLAYAMGDLAGAHHRAFVDGAFSALLKRAPERSESDTQLARLAAGTSKAEILGDLRWSPEGRRIGATVAGLRLRYLLAKASHVPLLGYLLDGALGIVALPLQARHQRAVETLFAARDETVRETLHALAERAGTLEQRVHALAEQTAAHTALLGRRIDDLHAFAQTLDASEVAQRARIEATEHVTAGLGGRLDELEFVRQRFYAINHWMHALQTAFAQIEDVARTSSEDRAARAARLAAPAFDADPSRVRRQQAWGTSFADALAAPATVLAFACGRDWTEGLLTRGFKVVHAEPNPALAEAARVEGVLIEPVGARELLQRAADDSVDGISILAASSVVSALPLLELLDAAARVLRAGGVLLLADAPEAPALVDDLLGVRRGARLDLLSPPLLRAAGFVEASRVDADDSIAWLLRRATA